MEPKPVVTSFIQYEGKILVLKRSDKVGTHRQRWAGVSGYLEKKEEPLKRALKEIEEETGLSEDQVELVKAGELLGIPDAENDIFWVIYPHLFKAKSDGVKIDWEHTEHRWIEPEDLVKYRTVPGLNETIQKVLPTPLERIVSDPRVLERIRRIEEDRSHGASHLARKAVEILVQASETDPADSVKDYLIRMKRLSERLMNLRPSMAALHNLVGELLTEIVERSATVSSLAELKRAVRDEAERLIKTSKEARRMIAEKAVKLIPEGGRILIHSYSSIVLETLKHAHDQNRKFEVIVTESRPLFEGRTAAEDLAEHGIPTTLVTDAAGGYFSANVNLVLLGADSLFADGSVINKVGTYPIVLSAAYQGVPIYVLAELSKISLRSYFTKILLEEKDQTEIWPDAPKTVAIRNLYFDLTPKFFITGVITESQRLRPDEILRICQEIVKRRYIV